MKKSILNFAALSFVFTIAGCGGQGVGVPINDGGNENIVSITPGTGESEKNNEEEILINPVGDPGNPTPGGLTTMATGTSTVPATRLAKLAKGINCSEWFMSYYLVKNGRASFLNRCDTFMTAADFQAIKNAGFNHIRLPLDPFAVWNGTNTGGLDEQIMVKYVNAINLATSKGLGVIVDAHPTDNAYLNKLNTQPTKMTEFKNFWAKLAIRLKSTNPEMVYFEILNEPAFSNLAMWWGKQAEIVSLIRAVMPNHTFLVGPDGYATWDRLITRPVIADKNIVYKIHFYEPEPFTHQGANWMSWGQWNLLQNVPYPLNSSNYAQGLTQVTDNSFRTFVANFAAKNYDAAKIRSIFDQVGAWSRTKGVPVIVNEFGVMRSVNEADRLNWLNDVSSAAKANGIGWCMWDYVGGFGVADSYAPGRPMNQNMLNVLNQN